MVILLLLEGFCLAFSNERFQTSVKSTDIFLRFPQLVFIPRARIQGVSSSIIFSTTNALAFVVDFHIMRHEHVIPTLLVANNNGIAVSQRDSVFALSLSAIDLMETTGNRENLLVNCRTLSE